MCHNSPYFGEYEDEKEDIKISSLPESNQGLSGGGGKHNDEDVLLDPLQPDAITN